MADASARKSSVFEKAQQSTPDERADSSKVSQPTGPNGLVVLPLKKSAHIPNVLGDFDLVAIHGLLGDQDKPWENPGSGDSSWMRYRYGESERVLSFSYDVRRILAGRQTRQVIQKQASKLLDDLMAVRKIDSNRRPIAFLAHDIGGIIVKEALVTASRNTQKYGDIFDYTRFLIFYGCPHRSNGPIDMKNRIARFLFGRFLDRRAGDAVTMKATEGLTAAILEINGLFLRSKNILRTYVVSMYTDLDQGGIDMALVFDAFCATIGAPFERQIKCSRDDQVKIFQNRQKMQLQLTPDSRTLNYERTLLNLAPPVFSFLTAYSPNHPFSWITSDKIYQAWLDHPDPQLLYVHGKVGAQEASEYIFYSLDKISQASEKNEVVVYFNFHLNDIRNASAKDMLVTFLAQIINHNPTLADFLLLQFNGLRQHRSSNEFDMLTWFEYFRIRGQIDGVTCVINYFDDCDEASRRGFLQRFSYISSVHERPWKIIVTSRQPGVLSKELCTWPSLDLDSTAAKATANTPSDSLLFVKVIKGLSKDKGLVKNRVAEFERLDPLRRRVILKQARVRDERLAHISLLSNFGSDGDLSLKSILKRILENIPDPDLSQQILTWVLYTFLPLTIWELGTAIFLYSPKDCKTKHTAGADFIEDIVGKIRTWFEGILHIRNDEIIVDDVQVRHALIELIGGKVASAHKTIAETCLDYLQRDSVMEIIETTYIQPYISAGIEPLSMDAPISPNRTSLYCYAINYWTRYYGLIPSGLRSADLLHSFVESKKWHCWSKGSWVLGSPISRSPRHQSFYPLLTAFGLIDDAEPWCTGDEDMSLALIEAAMHGFDKSVWSLLSRANHSIETLKDTLIATGSYGNENALIDLITHIKTRHKVFPWPASLLYRAAWLGHSKVVSELLDLGMPVHPDEPTERSTPLHNAAGNGHVNTLNILIKYGADISYRGPYGQTALHLACANGHAGTTSVLAEAGADLNARDDNNFTPLYEASLWGNFKAVEVLVNRGCDMSLGTSTEQGSLGWTPLIVSSEEGYIQCLKILLDAKSDPDLPGPHGTPLHYAVAKGHVNICQLLLEYGADPNHPKLDPPILTQIFINVKDASLRSQLLELFIEKGARVDATDGSEMSALLYAALLGDVSSVKYLLEHGADIKLEDIEGRTAFDRAVDQDHLEVVRLLIDKSEDLNRAEYYKQGLLFNAVKNPEMARLLLECGADQDVRSQGGVTPLMQAAGADNIETIKVLLEYEAAVDLVWHTNDGSTSGWTALAFAAERGSKEGVRLLIEAGANINCRMNDGSTALHLAMGGGAMRRLMEFRPNVNVTNDDGNTPLHCIRAWKEHEHVQFLKHVQLLVRAGASLDVQNKEGCTPLAIALRYSNNAVASYLIERHANVNLASQTYGAPLHIACQGSTVDMVRCLVDAKADINQPVLGILGTPLQAAALRRSDFEEASENIIPYLIDEAGADVNRTASAFGTVLAIAALQGSSTLVPFLLKKKADPKLADGMGRLPLHMAVLHELQNIKLLLDAGADVRARDNISRSVLHCAAQAGPVEVVHYLLELFEDTEDFDVDSKDNDGWTALCWAARGCAKEFSTRGTEAQIKVIRLLLERGADPGVRAHFSKSLWTPLEIAKYNDAPDEILELLNPTNAREAVGNDHEENKMPVPSNQDSTTRAFHHVDYYCMFCLGEIRGFRYRCNVCADFCFCSKCFNSRRKIHAEGHFFDEIGPEFASAFTSETSSNSSRDSATDSDIASEMNDDDISISGL